MAPDVHHQIDPRRTAGIALEVIAAVAAATGLVALLDGFAPVTGLGVLYLLAVLFSWIENPASRQRREP
jgi:hypothetical protein